MQLMRTSHLLPEDKRADDDLVADQLLIVDEPTPADEKPVDVDGRRPESGKGLGRIDPLGAMDAPIMLTLTPNQQPVS
jgi:hypothetical protein